jgi:hypothetical protein
MPAAEPMTPRRRSFETAATVKRREPAAGRFAAPPHVFLADGRSLGLELISVALEARRRGPPRPQTMKL